VDGAALAGVAVPEADRDMEVMEDMVEAIIEAEDAEADDAEATTACEAEDADMAEEGAAEVELDDEVEVEFDPPMMVSGAALTRAPVPIRQICATSRGEKRLTPLNDVTGVVCLLLWSDRLSLGGSNLLSAIASRGARLVTYGESGGPGGGGDVTSSGTIISNQFPCTSDAHGRRR